MLIESRDVVPLPMLDNRVCGIYQRAIHVRKNSRNLDLVGVLLQYMFGEGCARESCWGIESGHSHGDTLEFNFGLVACEELSL